VTLKTNNEMHLTCTSGNVYSLSLENQG